MTMWVYLHPRINFFINGILEITKIEKNDKAVAHIEITIVSKGAGPMSWIIIFSAKRKTGCIK